MTQDLNAAAAGQAAAQADAGAAMAAAYADAASAMLGLPIPADCRPGVVANLSLIFAQTAELMAMPMGDADEPAPVFRP